MKSKAQIEKELDREYKKAQPTAFLLAGTLLGLIGGFAANVVYDLYIRPNHFSSLLLLIASGGGFIFAFWYINRLNYARANKLEKQLKKSKKK